MKGEKPSETGEILQSATTVAGLAVGFATLVPSLQNEQVIYLWFIGKISLISLLILVCGVFALASSLQALNELRNEKGLTIRQFLSVASSIGLLFWSIILLGMVYILVIRNLVGT